MVLRKWVFIFYRLNGWAMKTIVNSIPGYRVFEYLVVITPKEDLLNRIMKIKEDFAGKFQVVNGKFGKPQIALVTLRSMV